jgi:hypothetical protein
MIKLKLGLQIGFGGKVGGGSGVGTTNNKPPGPIIMISQSETVSISQIKGVQVGCAAAEPKLFSWAKRGYIILTFLHPILLRSVTFSAPLGLKILTKYQIIFRAMRKF